MQNSLGRKNAPGSILSIPVIDLGEQEMAFISKPRTRFGSRARGLACVTLAVTSLEAFSICAVSIQDNRTAPAAGGLTSNTWVLCSSSLPPLSPPPRSLWILLIRKSWATPP